MCGIAGIISNKRISSNLIKNMESKIKHLEPDNEEYLFINENGVITSGGNDISDDIRNSNLLYS
ncbi:hypothetical protein [Fervidobacterium nodosum]|uniref:hypothetical protein n=1 Tax=Fervidobacterium nodosum TaxID=2424 RepID=UPI0002EA1D0D|nr:hypothetical protein [Fervidobacterium nodosum]